MTPSQQCDAMLDELSLLTYGVSYKQLSGRMQMEIIAEACLRFSDAQLEAGDVARKAEN